ncbi:MAG: hypothetical protein CM15mP74_23620 [Halieaceae bacterium]|nr:MAG: hypothetical protein CM15mP74_23620 [Halieaceae bacterium]
MKFTYRTLAVAVAAALVVPTQATFAQDENLTEEVVVSVPVPRDVLPSTHPLRSM